MEVASTFAGVLSTESKLLRPRDPESKGIVEWMNGFFHRGFMPGRDFIDPHDFIGQLDAWLPRANARYTRSRHGAPADLVVADRATMRALAPIPPDAVFRKEVRLPRDHYVRVHSNGYLRGSLRDRPARSGHRRDHRAGTT